mgnify:CR=1 FL=1
MTPPHYAYLKISEGCDNTCSFCIIPHLRGPLVSRPAADVLRVARALVPNPKFLLMDEPFAGVDPISVAEVQKIILQLKQRGIGVLITDHNVRETLGICSRAYIINEGVVLAAGRPDEIVGNETVVLAGGGLGNAVLFSIGRALREAGPAIAPILEALRHEGAEVYLTTTTSTGHRISFNRSVRSRPAMAAQQPA